MVVDDDLAMCVFLRDFLGRAATTRLTATNGDDALRRFHSDRPAAVLLDVVMRETWTGWPPSRVQENRQGRPGHRHLGAGAYQHGGPGDEAGATDFVCKPFQEHELEVLLGAALKQRAAQPGSGARCVSN
jgi:DNA-binding response OmpR family regulator